MNGESKFTDPKRPTDLHSSVRRQAATLSAGAMLTAKERLAICKSAMSTDNPDAFRPLNATPPIERYYWISALYMLLMPTRRRQRLAAYFTPPHICRHVLDQLEANGANPLNHSVLDPAAGGAAFLIPWALRLAAYAKKQRWSQDKILTAARSQLAGIEIEPGLAKLSEYMLANVLGTDEPENPYRDPIVKRANALRSSSVASQHEVVVCNPPYGRVFRPSPALKQRWSAVISEGHVNTYALFVALSIERAKEHGLIALVLPTSFLGGPYFSAMRAHILANCTVLGISLIEKRAEEFLDVTQDTCALFLAKRQPLVSDATPPCLLVHADGTTKHIGTIDLPVAGTRPWAIPIAGVDPQSQFDDRLATLQDYGYGVRSGYFVWNRSLHQMADRKEPQNGEVPLIWAHNVKPCEPVEPTSRHSPGLGTFVLLPHNSRVSITRPCIVLQRTTNRSQKRRLIPGIITQELLNQYGAVITENHTLVVFPIENPAISVKEMSKIIHSKPVDDRYRSISGSVSISTKLLRQLRLPRPRDMITEITRHGGVTDEAVEAAYAATLKEP